MTFGVAGWGPVFIYSFPFVVYAVPHTLLRSTCPFALLPY